jgi:hypothetical protein
MNQSVAAIFGAIIGAFIAYMIAAFVLCLLLDLGNLCGLPAVFIGQPIGAIAGAIVGWRLGRRSS